MWNITFGHQEFIRRLRFISDICWCGINILQQSFLHFPEGSLCLFWALWLYPVLWVVVRWRHTYRTPFNLVIKAINLFFFFLHTEGVRSDFTQQAKRITELILFEFLSSVICFLLADSADSLSLKPQCCPHCKLRCFLIKQLSLQSAITHKHVGNSTW